MECGLDLGRGAAEADRHAIFGDSIDREPLPRKPVGNGGYIGFRGAEVCANLIGVSQWW